MNNFSFDIKNDSTYKTGINVGFFAGFLMFASVFFFIMKFFNKLPSVIKYYHAFLLVVVIYFSGYIFLKFGK